MLKDRLANLLLPPTAGESAHGVRANEALRGYLWAVLITGLATAVGWPLYHRLHLADTNVLMFYLLGVLWIATRYSRRAAILASVLGVLAFDFCFVPPYFTLSVADRQYLITFAVMLLTALVISTLTHRVRAQALAARQAWERAEAEFLRNTLLSSVSHDLRTPVASITGASSALIEGGEHLSPHARAEMLDTIHSEAERMERLINNLLDMTRLESGGLSLKREWQHLQELAGSALRPLKKRLHRRLVITRIPADLLAFVDGPAIEQVLVNLVDNAVEFTPAGTLIEIEARAADATIVIEVADRGPGLPPEAVGRVFEKFFRFAPEAAGKREGVGLGLAICRGIVEAHGGTIDARNRRGGGSVFRITIPCTETPPRVDGTG